MQFLLSIINFILFINPVTNEVIYTLNAKKPLYFVSDKFVILSVDPAILLNGLNSGSADDILALDKISKFPKFPNNKIWMLALKSEQLLTFKSAMDWAKLIENTANLGFEFSEFFGDTPAFWVTFFYKKLMGRTVLEIKSNQNSETSIYCHCTKTQNNFGESNGVTIFAINDDVKAYNISLNLVGIFMKSIEVQSYILSSNSENSTRTYLNNKKLNIEMLKDNLSLIPKLRRIKIEKYLTLNIPPISIAFFVLSDIKIPACVSNGTGVNLITSKNNGKQNINFVDNSEPEITTGFQDLINTFKKLHVALKINGKHMEWKPIDGTENILVKGFREIDRNEVIKANDNGNVTVTGKKKTDFDKNKLIPTLQTKCELTDVEETQHSITKRENFVYMLSNISPSKINSRRRREGKGGGRGRSGGHGSSKRKRIRILPKAMKRVNVSKRDINMVLLQQKSEEINKKSKKIESKDNYGQSSKKKGYVPVLQPEYLYKKQQMPEERKLDIKKIVEELHKSYEAKSKNKTQTLYKNKTEDNEDFDLDYLDSDDYDDIFEENSRHIGDVNKFIQTTKFPIRPTFRYKKLNVKPVPSPKNIDSWLNKEIVIDKNGSVEEAIKELEAYLNQDNYERVDPEPINFSNMDYYDDIDYDDYTGPSRYKRDANQQFTEEDILYYKQLMNSNIRHMRQNMRKQKIKNLPPKQAKSLDMMKNFKQRKPVENFSYKPILFPERYHLDEGLSRYQKIKSSEEDFGRRSNLPYLFRPKAVNSYQKIPKQTRRRFGGFYSLRKPDEIREIIRPIKSELRTVTAKPANLIEVKHGPNTRGGVMKERISNFPNKRGWKKQYTLPFTPRNYPGLLRQHGENNYVNILQNKRNLDNFNKEPLTESFEENEQGENYLNRSKRYIDEDIAELEDDLNNNINDILEDNEYIIPDFDQTEISLILPVNNAIFVTNLERPPENSSIYYSCPLLKDTQTFTEENLDD